MAGNRTARTGGSDGVETGSLASANRAMMKQPAVGTGGAKRQPQPQPQAQQAWSNWDMQLSWWCGSSPVGRWVYLFIIFLMTVKTKTLRRRKGGPDNGARPAGVLTMPFDEKPPIREINRRSWRRRRRGEDTATTTTEWRVKKSQFKATNKLSRPLPQKRPTINFQKGRARFFFVLTAPSLSSSTVLFR